MIISDQKKWLSVVTVVTISGVLLASSLMSAIPAQAWSVSTSPFITTATSTTSISPMASLNISFNRGKSYPQLMQERFKGVAFRVPLDNKQQQEELQNQSMTEPEVQSTASEKPTVEALPKSTVTTTPNKPKPVPPQASSKTQQTAPKSTSQAVARGAGEVDRLINRALSLQGVPYLWGGTTPKGFDCSGFVGYVLKASGVSLPRTSFDMYKVGTPVNRDQLKPGDLVFFSTYKAGPSDVRIYIGGGRTIGAASDGIAIHSLSESYWNRTYLGARRVL